MLYLVYGAGHLETSHPVNFFFFYHTKIVCTYVRMSPYYLYGRPYKNHPYKNGTYVGKNLDFSPYKSQFLFFCMAN